MEVATCVAKECSGRATKDFAGMKYDSKRAFICETMTSVKVRAISTKNYKTSIGKKEQRKILQESYGGINKT